MGALVGVPPPAWVSDAGNLRTAIVRVVEREREFWQASLAAAGESEWRRAGSAAVEAWAALAEVIGVDVAQLLDAADRFVTEERS